MKLSATLPVFLTGAHQTLATELHGFIGIQGFHGGQLPPDLTACLKADLDHNPCDLEGIPGLKVGVADTGASSICRKDQHNFLPDSYELLTSPITIGGIAGGVPIVGKGKTRFEFVTSKGKTVTLT